jgi:hypothetical protein
MKHSRSLLVVAASGILISLHAIPVQGGPVTVFSGPGPYLLPETISQAPAGFGSAGGKYIVPDFNNLNVWAVPTTGGAPTNIATNFANNTFVGVRGGVFLPSNWGSNAGNFLEVGQVPVSNTAAPVLIVSPNGSSYSVSAFSNITLNGGQPQIAPSGFGSYGGDVVVPNYDSKTLNSTITIIAPNGTTTSLASGSSLPLAAGGAAFAPSGFGALGGDLFVDGLSSDHHIDAVDANGNVTPFVNVPLQPGQLTPFQMAFSPSGFLPGEGSLLFVSIRGSTQGGGTLGDVLAYDSNGTLVASLRTDLGLSSFDPRGLLFIPDPSNPSQTDLLISDASSGRILLFAPQAFTATPEPSSLALCTAGLLSLVGGRWWRRKRVV